MTANRALGYRLNTNKLLEVNNPFCNDSRIAEEGNALEAAVHVCIPSRINSIVEGTIPMLERSPTDSVLERCDNGAKLRKSKTAHDTFRHGVMEMAGCPPGRVL